MKDSLDSAAVGRVPEADESPARPAADAPPPHADGSFANRKLIRPSLRDFDPDQRADRRPHQRPFRPAFAGEAPAPLRGPEEASLKPAGPRRDHGRRSSGDKRPTPPEQTHAENFYYQKQMQSKTMMTVVLTDGEKVDGVIEWYDRSCIKLTRPGGENVLVYKSAIKYMHKQE